MSGGAVISERLGPTVPLMSNSPDQWIAADGMVLRVLAGSAVHGLATGPSDRDEMGICIEPPHMVVGLRQFEHYRYRTQPEGVVSGPGDLDLIVYSLRKFARLAAAGNPTVLSLLFTPEPHQLYVDDIGRALIDRRAMFSSRQAGAKFRGYLESQRRGLMGLRSGGTRNQGRADIRERYGFDVKFAAHMVRLGLQGVEFLRTGQITMPVPEPHRTWLLELRRGEHSKAEALTTAERLERQIEQLMTTSPLPERPDLPAINAFLIEAHRQHWGWA